MGDGVSLRESVCNREEGMKEGIERSNHVLDVFVIFTFFSEFEEEL